ncbi:MAG: CPBP family intramembrane metalloprotease [Oscillospiraceae bacterium]|nr:CPBP family intramembrane metalloprotease [Oscillospiraceae bacterium]
MISEKRRDIIQILIAAALITFFFCTNFDPLWYLLARKLFSPFPLFLHFVNYDYLFFTVLFVLFIRFAFKHTFKEAGFTWNKETAVFGVFCLLYLLIPIAINIFSIKSTYNVWVSPQIFIIPIINNFLLIGVMEELVFRGFIFNKMCKFVSGKRSFIYAVLISATFFFIVHIPSWIQYFRFIDIGLPEFFDRGYWIVFVMGIWTAAYYFYTKNLTMCILVHGVNNCIVSYTTGALSYICAWVFWIAAILLLLIKIKKSDFNSLIQKGN